MSTLHDTTTTVNAGAETQAPAPDATASATAPEQKDHVIPGATPAEQKKLDEYAALEARVVDLAVQTLDPKDATKKFAKLGAECLKLARLRKSILAVGSFDKEEFDAECRKLATLIKMRVPIKKLDMGCYVRLALWIEAVRPHVPNVADISFFQATHKFNHTLKFDVAELTGELRKEWTAWLLETLPKQLGDKPLSMKELDASIAEREAEIESAKKKKSDPEKELERLQKEAERKKRKEREDSLSRISDAIDQAIIDEHADAQSVREIAAKVLKDHDLTLPTEGAFDAKTATVNDVLAIAKGLFEAGKVAEMRRLHATLGQMLQVIEAAVKTSAAA